MAHLVGCLQPDRRGQDVRFPAHSARFLARSPAGPGPASGPVVEGGGTNPWAPRAGSPPSRRSPTTGRGSIRQRATGSQSAARTTSDDSAKVAPYGIAGLRSEDLPMLTRLQRLRQALLEALRGNVSRRLRRQAPCISGSWLEERALLSGQGVQRPLLRVAPPAMSITGDGPANVLRASVRRHRRAQGGSPMLRSIRPTRLTLQPFGQVALDATEFGQNRDAIRQHPGTVRPGRRIAEDA
jgi:hypothetical protein